MDKTKLYDRIEAMNAVGKLIMDGMITQDAAEMFDTGYYEECPDKYSYMNLQYGMRALYIKYCAKTVNLAFELRLQLNGWYFNQPLDQTLQFKEQHNCGTA